MEMRLLKAFLHAGGTILPPVQLPAVFHHVDARCLLFDKRYNSPSHCANGEHFLNHLTKRVQPQLKVSPDASLTGRELRLLVQFHANSWALAFGAPMFGAKLVLPGGSYTVMHCLHSSHGAEHQGYSEAAAFTLAAPRPCSAHTFPATMVSRLL